MTGYPRPKPTSKWDAATRSLVHRAGLRYLTRRPVMHGTRPNGQSAFCTPDLTFPGRRVAVFLDGCYWHGCPEHHPERDASYDSVIDAGLARRGWSVLRVWEHEGPERAAELIALHVSERVNP